MFEYVCFSVYLFYIFVSELVALVHHTSQATQMFRDI